MKIFKNSKTFPVSWLRPPPVLTEIKWKEREHSFHPHFLYERFASLHTCYKIISTSNVNWEQRFSDSLENADATVDHSIDPVETFSKKNCIIWYEVPKKTLSDGKNSKHNGVCKTNDWIKREILFLNNNGVKLSLLFFTVNIYRYTIDRNKIWF